MKAMIDADIEELKTRNALVEAQKAWEVSATRRACIATITYVVALAILLLIGVSRPYLGATIPTAGFLLSTLSIGFVKKLWLAKVYDKNAAKSL